MIGFGPWLPDTLFAVSGSAEQCLAVKASVATMMLKEQKLVPKKLPGRIVGEASST